MGRLIFLTYFYLIASLIHIAVSYTHLTLPTIQSV